MASLQEHLEEEAKARERVDKHLTKRSATESSILKEVLTLVTLYGKLGESIERIESELGERMQVMHEKLHIVAKGLHKRLDDIEKKLDVGQEEEPETEPYLFAKTVNLKASLPGAYVTTSQPERFEERAPNWEEVKAKRVDRHKQEALDERFASYKPDRWPTDEQMKEWREFRANWKRDPDEPMYMRYVGPRTPEQAAEAARAEIDKRFASYKPYGPPPGFPDEDESYGDAS